MIHLSGLGFSMQSLIWLTYNKTHHYFTFNHGFMRIQIYTASQNVCWTHSWEIFNLIKWATYSFTFVFNSFCMGKLNLIAPSYLRKVTYHRGCKGMLMKLIRWLTWSSKWVNGSTGRTVRTRVGSINLVCCWLGFNVLTGPGRIWLIFYILSDKYFLI